MLSAEPPLLLTIDFMLTDIIKFLLHKALSIDGPGQSLVCWYIKLNGPDLAMLVSPRRLGESARSWQQQNRKHPISTRG